MNEKNRSTQPIIKDDVVQDHAIRIGNLPFEQDSDIVKLLLPAKNNYISIQFELDGKAILGRFIEGNGGTLDKSSSTTLSTTNRSHLTRLAKLPKSERDKIMSLCDETDLQRISLIEYGGELLGVSREHAALIREDTILILFDLGSTNGTFLNGLQLLAFQSRIVRDGDELQLGMFKATFQFSLDQEKESLLLAHSW